MTRIPFFNIALRAKINKITMINMIEEKNTGVCR